MVIWQPAGGPAVLYAPEVCQALSNVPKKMLHFWSLWLLVLLLH